VQDGVVDGQRTVVLRQPINPLSAVMLVSEVRGPAMMLLSTERQPPLVVDPHRL
jgi:hypothetical protein